MIARWQVRKKCFSLPLLFYPFPPFLMCSECWSCCLSLIPWVLLSSVIGCLSDWPVWIKVSKIQGQFHRKKWLKREEGRERDPPTGSSAPQQTTHMYSFTPFFVVNVFISSLFYPLFFFLPISFLQDFLLLVRSMITPRRLMYECVTCLLPTWHRETGNRRVLSLNWPYETHHRVPRQYKICSIMYRVHLQHMPIIYMYTLVTVMHTQQQNKLSQFVWFNRQYKTFTNGRFLLAATWITHIAILISTII